MSRTDKVIFYLDWLKHILMGRANSGNTYYKEELEFEVEDIDNLIKELNEHGCRRTIDGCTDE
ncbi:MAG: hypothetical protein IKL53_10185 [Lachnospiraceae bacterium]|nr:hypothetical protein [Lachnospiraceae bacterium]